MKELTLLEKLLAQILIATLGDTRDPQVGNDHFLFPLKQAGLTERQARQALDRGDS